MIVEPRVSIVDGLIELLQLVRRKPTTQTALKPVVTTPERQQICAPLQTPAPIQSPAASVEGPKMGFLPPLTQHHAPTTQTPPNAVLEAPNRDNQITVEPDPDYDPRAASWD